MATQADVRRIALKLPDVVEAENDFAFCVPIKGKLKGFVWSWKERVIPKIPDLAALQVSSTQFNLVVVLVLVVGMLVGAIGSAVAASRFLDVRGEGPSAAWHVAELDAAVRVLEVVTGRDLAPSLIDCVAHLLPIDFRNHVKRRHDELPKNTEAAGIVRGPGSVPEWPKGAVCKTAAKATLVRIQPGPHTCDRRGCLRPALGRVGSRRDAISGAGAARIPGHRRCR